jgi:formylglycine-generating enzyme
LKCSVALDRPLNYAFATLRPILWNTTMTNAICLNTIAATTCLTGVLFSVLVAEEPPARLKAPFDVQEARAGQEVWAKHLNVEIVVTNSLGQQLILIPPGEFTMGRPGPRANPAQVNRPEQSVVLTKPFRIGLTEVTQGQWKNLMNTEPWRGMEYVKTGDNFAACFISAKDADAFVRKLNELEQTDRYRLPTEAEWEYACRAGTTSIYYFGPDATLLSEHAWWGGADDSDGNCRNEQYAHRVAQKRSNPFGLFDMLGNVSESCSDWYRPYPDPGERWVDPQGPKSGVQRVSRGGNWIYPADLITATVRHWIEPDFRDQVGGFRIVQSVGE